VLPFGMPGRNRPRNEPSARARSSGPFQRWLRLFRFLSGCSFPVPLTENPSHELAQQRGHL